MQIVAYTRPYGSIDSYIYPQPSANVAEHLTDFKREKVSSGIYMKRGTSTSMDRK